MKVARWGNSLAVRLPAAVVEAMQIKDGDDIEIIAANAKMLAVNKKPEFEELLARVRRYRGRMPKDFKFNREELYERDR